MCVSAWWIDRRPVASTVDQRSLFLCTHCVSAAWPSPSRLPTSTARPSQPACHTLLPNSTSPPTPFPQAYYAVLEYTPPSLLPAIWGAILCFFGGEYITVIAAIESFEHSGGDAALKAAWALADQAFAAIDASTAGNEAALAKLESRELLAHKAAIVANALDPAVTQASLGQLYLCAIRSARCPSAPWC